MNLVRVGVLVAVLVEGAVGEGQHVGLQGLDRLEMLILLLIQLHDQLYFGQGLLSISVFS